MDGLGYLRRTDLLQSLNICYGAGYFENSVVSPGAQPQPIDSGLQETVGILIQVTEPLEQPGRHLGIAINAGTPKTPTLNDTRCGHTRPDVL